VDTMTSPCAICGGGTALGVVASERMMGLGGEYRYDLCGECGCLQLRDVPPNLGDFYAGGYYAFAEPVRPTRVRGAYRRVRDAMLLGRFRSVRLLLAPFVPRRVLEVGEWFATTQAHRKARILDVGCGVGLLLRRLVDDGYTHVSGVDPFVDADIVYHGRTLVRKAWIAELDGEYDVVMFHHSLEHIADQAATMGHVARLLAPGGHCLIRIPTVSSYAWEEYRDRWVQLDAPRHLYLHSLDSLERLATASGLRLERVVYDSTEFQFEGSELYRRGLTLQSINGQTFSRLQRWQFKWRANRLNARSRGDQAAFYLRKA
jgi:SAM-dependent methyltransferase